MWSKVLSGIVIVIFIIVAGTLLLSRFSIPGVDFLILSVQSGSMEPAIKTGSVVIVAPSELYTEEDIITFSRSKSSLNAPVTHRVVAVEVIGGEYVYTVKGDANEYADTEKVLKKEVLGKVMFSVPYLGWLIDTVKTPLGFTVLIIIPAVIIIGDEVKKIISEIKKDGKKKEEKRNTEL